MRFANEARKWRVLPNFSQPDLNEESMKSGKTILCFLAS
jgi:hypothetical protein